MVEPRIEQSAEARRRWLYIPFIIAGVILAAYYVFWLYAAGEMKKAVSVWVDTQRDAGLIVSHGDIRADGFPFFLRVHIEAPDIKTSTGLYWRAENLSLDALPYDLNRLIFSPSGEQQIAIANGDEWIVTADDLRASIANDNARGWVFAMTIHNAKAQQQNNRTNFSIKSLVFDLAPDNADVSTLTLVAAAEAIEGKSKQSSLRLDKVETVIGLTASDALYGPYAMEQWRNAAGAVIITGFNIVSHEAALSVTGNLSLDHNGYPSGQLHSEIVNPAGLSTLLNNAGILSSEEAEITSANLTLMALASGGKIAAPIDFKNGAVEIAGAKIANLPGAD